MAEAFGLTVDDLPADWRPLRVLVIVECIDLTDDSPDSPGTKKLATRSDVDLDVWTAIGMLEAASADLKQQYVESLGAD